MTDTTTVEAGAPAFEKIRETMDPISGWVSLPQKKVFQSFLLTAGNSPAAIGAEFRAAKLWVDAAYRDEDPAVTALFRDGFRDCLEEGTLRCLSHWTRLDWRNAGHENTVFFGMRAYLAVVTFGARKPFAHYCIEYLAANTRPEAMTKAHEYALRIAEAALESARLPRAVQRSFVEGMMRSTQDVDLVPAFREYLVLNGHTRF